jgi:hypothetical protein
VVGRTYRAANDLLPLIGINVAQETTHSQALPQSLVTRLHRTFMLAATCATQLPCGFQTAARLRDGTLTSFLA